MIKKIILCVFLFIFISTSIFAANGKQLFIKNCLNCHRNGGKAAPVNPADKAGRVWKRYFKRGRHADNDKLISSIGEENFKKILQYLINNAADSDHPEEAVIPK